MRYSRWALLLFGAGLLLGLAIVSADLRGLAHRVGWLSSLMMAAGVALLPPALVADWWSYRPWRKPAPKRKPRARSSRQPNRTRKSSPPRKRGSRSK
jgi:hypothetical protein